MGRIRVRPATCALCFLPWGVCVRGLAPLGPTISSGEDGGGGGGMMEPGAFAT